MTQSRNQIRFPDRRRLRIPSFSVFTCQRARWLSPPQSPPRRRLGNRPRQGRPAYIPAPTAPSTPFFQTAGKFFPAIPRSSLTSPRPPNQPFGPLGEASFYLSAPALSTPFSKHRNFLPAPRGDRRPLRPPTRTNRPSGRPLSTPPSMHRQRISSLIRLFSRAAAKAGYSAAGFSVL
jgi:hypothetical protein